MSVRQKPVGAILYRAGKGAAGDVVYAVAKWRDSTGRQNYRRLGRAWMEPDGSGGWRRRRGRAPEGCLDRRAAERAMDALIDEVEAELVSVRPDREATFAHAVAAWREYAEHTKRLKPATLRNYDALLSPPGEGRGTAGSGSRGSCASSESGSLPRSRLPRSRGSSEASTVRGSRQET